MEQLIDAPPDATERDAELGERRTSPVELLWDLVFVFAVTQVTAMLYHDPNWTRLGEAMLVLALVWWAWSAFVWAANAQATTSPTLRISLLLGTIAIFITGLAVPHAYGSEGVLFAVTYAVVRLGHLALYADLSRRGSASWQAIAGFGAWTCVALVLLLAGSFMHGGWRVALWAVAAAIDYAGPAWLTRERLRGLQSVAVEHFAERYGLFVIICLGESVVAIGVGAQAHLLDAEIVLGVALALIITGELWWAYFTRFAATAQERLRHVADPVLVAADAYSYVHLLIVAGIITFAVGAKLSVGGSSGPGGFALAGGAGLYVAGQIGFAWRMVGAIDARRSAVAIALLALCPFADDLARWLTAAIVSALLVCLCSLTSAR